MGPELDKQQLQEEKDWMLTNTEPFMSSENSATITSSTLSLFAMVITLFHNIVWSFPDDGAQATDSRLEHRCRPYAVYTPPLNPRDALQFTSFTFVIKVCISVTVEGLNIEAF